MKRRIAFSFVVMAIIYFWYSKSDISLQTSSEQLANTSPPTTSISQQNHPPLPSTIKKTESRVDEVKKLGCLEVLRKESGTDKCDANCFGRQLAKHDNELSTFISEGWWNKKLKDRLPSRSHMGRLNEALELANALLTNQDMPPSNLPLAEQKLRRLVQDDPNNSYPLYFLASILIQAGKLNEAKIVLKRSRLLPLQSYPQNAAFKLRYHGLENLQHHLNSMEIWSSMPLPDYRILKNLEKVDPEAVAILGKRLVADSLFFEGKYADVLWIALEQAVGKNLLESVSPNEANLIPDYKELMERNGQSFETSWAVNPDNCSIKEVEKVMKKYKEELDNDIARSTSSGR